MPLLFFILIYILIKVAFIIAPVICYDNSKLSLIRHCSIWEHAQASHLVIKFSMSLKLVAIVKVCIVIYFIEIRKMEILFKFFLFVEMRYHPSIRSESIVIMFYFGIQSDRGIKKNRNILRGGKVLKYPWKHQITNFSC